MRKFLTRHSQYRKFCYIAAHVPLQRSSDIFPGLGIRPFALSLFLGVGIEEKTSNSFFSPCFFPFMPKTKEQITLLLFRSQKSSNSHEKPKSKIPTLHFPKCHCRFVNIFLTRQHEHLHQRCRKYFGSIT